MLNINELDVISSRKLDFIPNHFSKLKLSEKDYFVGNVEDWIKNRLKHRYAIVNWPAIDDQEKLKVSVFVAFEDQKELTYFILACPFLRRNQ